MTYAELIQSLQDWVESNETSLVANLDFIIELAEKRIYRSIDLDNGRKSSSLALVQGTGLVSLPADSVVVRAIAYQVTATGAMTYLLPKETTYIDDYTGNRTDVLLYACLLEVSTYQLQEPDIIAQYEKMYQMAFQGSLLEENFRNRGDEYRSNEVKVQM